MSETALKCENYAIYQSKLYSRTVFAFKTAYSCFFSSWGNLDVLYNINYRKFAQSAISSQTRLANAVAATNTKNYSPTKQREAFLSSDNAQLSQSIFFAAPFSTKKVSKNLTFPEGKRTRSDFRQNNSILLTGKMKWGGLQSAKRQPVWPDLAKLRHFTATLKTLAILKGSN